ncbi:hypothetical protein CLU93_1275 [Janthinobacterium sp. 35]|uniref:hypothetical protein n=1 Tax=Janthinobacterium sp. 35 TaxID=2035210 RepID=UPI000C17587B|nr:hypothetical protein [Janthinobacterium sp. 35]PIG27050.1 hypothetical protein CLU93_1275 [Janthinobacterium sp. 35]
MIDYSIYYQQELQPDEIDGIPHHDIFVSAFNSSARVRKVYEQISADRKLWLVHPEYRYSADQLPKNQDMVVPKANNEAEQVYELLASLGSLDGKTLCVDITGFMRHVLISLMSGLARVGVAQVTVLYSEPESYAKQEATQFSTSTSGTVRTIFGMRQTRNEQAPDALILGVGFDDKLISEVINHKEHLLVYPVLGFPSLSPDMFQQSAVRAARSAAPALDEAWITKRFFAPANNPFSTATVVSEIVRRLDSAGTPPNIYLSPLSTKVQVLGFVLYWILEGQYRGAVSPLLPECDTYAQETTIGLKRLWKYDVELKA